MRKKSLLLAFLLLIAMGMRAEDGVVLLLRNGNSVKFAFSETPVLVTGETLKMKTTTESVDYDYAEVVRSYFDDVTSAVKGVKPAGKSDCLFRLTTSGMEVSGLASGEKVYVYSASGKQVCSAQAVDGQANIALPAGSHQVYIVKTNHGVAFKFTRK